MTVIEKLRASTESTSTRFIIIVVAAIFAFAGGNSARGDGCAGGMAATVNGETVSTTEFDKAWRANSRRAGSDLDDEQRGRLASSTLDQLISQRVQLQEARRLGLAVSDAEIVRSIRGEKAFQKDGVFDEKTMLDVLQRMGVGRAEFEAEQRDFLLLRKLEEIAVRGVLVTEAEVRTEWTRDNTDVDLTVIRFPPGTFYDDIEVPDADRDAHVLAYGPAIESRYKADYDRSYSLPKRYHLRTILLRTDLPGVDEAAVAAKAEAVAKEAQSGVDFSGLARRWSEDLSAKDGGDLGMLAADSVDPALAAAADAAGGGKVTGVVKTGRGLQVLRVEAIEAARVIPLEEAKLTIAVQMLKDAKVEGVAADYAAKIIAAWTPGGPPPVELAAARSLAVVQTGSFSLGESSVPSVGDGPDVAELMAAVAKIKSGDVLPVALTIKGIPYAVQLTTRVEPDPSTYEEGARLVRGRLEYLRRQTFMAAWAESLEADATIVRYLGQGS
ncbi:MAG: hypothetical protein EXR71_01590 [Myxococcales bacterium]|nr:hypothetical protein [Myxococcales bacterium]